MQSNNSSKSPVIRDLRAIALITGGTAGTNTSNNDDTSGGGNDDTSGGGNDDTSGGGTVVKITTIQELLYQQLHSLR